MTNMDDKFEKIFPHVYRNKETGEIHRDIKPRAIEWIPIFIIASSLFTSQHLLPLLKTHIQLAWIDSEPYLVVVWPAVFVPAWSCIYEFRRNFPDTLN